MIKSHNLWCLRKQEVNVLDDKRKNVYSVRYMILSRILVELLFLFLYDLFTFTCVFQNECHWFVFKINSTKENQWSWAFFRIRPVALPMEFYLRTQFVSLRLQILWKDHFWTSYSWVTIDRRFYWKVASKRWRSKSTYLLFLEHETLKALK